MMGWFIAAAALSAVVAGALILRPLLRHAPGSTRAALATAGAVLFALLTAGALYWHFTNWPWSAPPATDPATETVRRLQRAVGSDAANQDAWLQLGQAYLQMEQFELARRAFERARTTPGNAQPAALSGLAETILLGGDSANAPRAAALFEEALKLDPKSPKALFYTALAAMQTGQLQLARDRFALMLTLEAPADIKAALQRQVDALDQQLNAPTPVIDPATVVRVSIDVDASLATQLPPNAALFVFVRNPAGGPPLAVKRLPARFPQQVQLSAADSMLEGVRIAAHQAVRVVARISNSGSPTEQPGDPSAQIDMKAGATGEASLLIGPRAATAR